MIGLELSTRIEIDESVAKAANLCDRFAPDDLKKIGMLVMEGYKRDKQSRIDWETRMEAGMDLAMQIQKEKNFPWPGASNVIFPLITIASLQFSARSYENIVQGTDVVRYRTVGADASETLRNRADRISRHMSWQVLEEDTAWEAQHDSLLINLGIVGTAFIKTYFSTTLNHNVSELVLARDLVVDYWAKSIETAQRKTHIKPLFRNEIYERVKRGIFRDVLASDWYNSTTSMPETNDKQDNRAGVQQPSIDTDTPFRTLEQHRNLDLDGDGYAEPYIVTVEERSGEVLRIVARWESEKAVEYVGNTKEILQINATEYFTKYSFIPSPDGSIYDIGFGVLLGPLNEGVNTGINQLFDCGTMANSNGGFLGRGAKIRGGVYSFSPWQWNRVDSTGDDLRKSLVQFPVREPSTVMLQLLQLLIEYTDRVAGTTDPMVGKNPGQNTPAETSRNTLEQGMRVYSAIFKRVWRSLKEEFKKLHDLNGQYLPVTSRFGEKNDFVRREDYSGNPNQVVPVADPNITSNALRLTQAMHLRQAAAEMPGYDRPTVEKRFLKAMQVDGVDEVYPGPDKVPPLPNPKGQIEEMKLKGQQMKIDFEKWKFIQELQDARRLNQAQINLYQAQIVEIMAGVQTEAMKLKIEAFEQIVDALETHDNMLMRRIEAAQGAQENGSADGKGMGTMGNGAANPGVQGAAPGMAPGANGAMGQPGLPG